MCDKSLHYLVHTEQLVPRLNSKLSIKDLVVPVVRTLEHLVDLEGGLLCLEALFDHIGREFQLTQAHEVTSNEVENLVISHVRLELEHILYQIVAEGVLDQEVDAADNHVSERQFLPLEALLQAALHHAAAVLV